MYDKITSQFLDENTRHPANNLGGQVVWNTRYYLESLLTAYQATNNRKYIDAFKDSATWVLNMTQTVTVLDVPDPSAPGQTATAPVRKMTGWPTYMGTFGQAISVPTTSGAVAFYAQSLYPRYLFSPSEAVVSHQTDGTLQLAWSRGGKNIQVFPVRRIADLNAIESLPLVLGRSPARLKSTGMGLPAPGKYTMNVPLTTIWHGEQTGGILIPVTHFLVLNKTDPGLIDQETASAWQSKIVSLASEYEDQFASDGTGGFTIHNPRWMPSIVADTDAAADYVYAEATFRILLYELTSDSRQLDFARGLVSHQVSKHWETNPQGWLLLKEWPCIKSWTSRSEAPAGSIWDSLQYDPLTPEITQATLYLAELFHIAEEYNVTAAVGLNEGLLASHRSTFQNFIRVPTDPTKDLLLRSTYPREGSTSADRVSFNPDLFALTGFVYSETSEVSFVPVAWQALLAQGQSPKADPIGYFLLAWARTESAHLVLPDSGE